MTPYTHHYRSRRRRQKTGRIIWIALLAALVALALFGVIWHMARKPATPPPDETSDTAESLPAGDTSADTKPAAPQPSMTTVRQTEADLHRGDLILVRAGIPYVFPDTTDSLLDLYSHRKKYDSGARAYQISGTDLYLSEPVLARLNAMNEAFYEETGLNALLVKSAYRSREEQEELFAYRVERDGEEEARRYVALPGESEHHTGMAFDMSVYRDGANTYLQDEPDFAWILENAAAYGFVLRYPEDKIDITGIAYEGWHFRYVGVPHATYMTEEHLCLEEYLDRLRTDFSYSGEHLFVTTADGSYEMYYVPASDSGTTDVLVPAGASYTLSGDNATGYIVTVALDTAHENSLS